MAQVERPESHGPASGPSVGLEALGISGDVRRPLGGRANMHWLVDVGHDRLVVRRYGPWRTLDEVEWELELQRRLSSAGWRVPAPVGDPALVGRHVWAAMTWVPGRRRRPRTDRSRIGEQRTRGRLLGELHLAMQAHRDLGRRPGGAPLAGSLDETGAGPSIDDVLGDRSLVTPDAEVVFRGYADRARTLLVESGSATGPPVIVHGDLNPTNVLYTTDGAVTVIDFDQARLDVVGAEFVWAPRRHPWAMVDGFCDVVPLPTGARDVLAPLSWIAVLEAVRRDVQWPSRPLPDAFVEHQSFLADTPLDAFDAR